MRGLVHPQHGGVGTDLDQRATGMLDGPLDEDQAPDPPGAVDALEDLQLVLDPARHESVVVAGRDEIVADPGHVPRNDDVEVVPAQVRERRVRLRSAFGQGAVADPDRLPALDDDRSEAGEGGDQPALGRLHPVLCQRREVAALPGGGFGLEGGDDRCGIGIAHRDALRRGGRALP